jgi:hypothetical protein
LYHKGHSKWVIAYGQERGHSPEPNTTGPLILGFQSLELGEVNFWSFIESQAMIIWYCSSSQLRH